MRRLKQVKLKAGTKVCHIDYPETCFYGTLEEDTKKGYPAILRVESKPKFNYSVVAYRASKLRKCTKEDFLMMAIDKMKGDNDGRGEIA